MTVETGAVVPDVPAPLGWCSPCLAERGQDRQAVTTAAGTAVCRECNAAAHEAEGGQAQMADLAAQAQQQLQQLFAPPQPGGRAGF